jgi:hypothetical protein
LGRAEAAIPPCADLAARRAAAPTAQAGTLATAQHYAEHAADGKPKKPHRKNPLWQMFGEGNVDQRGRTLRK